MAKIKKPSLKAGQFYRAIEPRWFGPNDVDPPMRECLTSLSVPIGSILECVSLRRCGHEAWMGRGYYAFFKVIGRDFTFSIKLTKTYTSPYWVNEVSALEQLATAALD